MKKITALILALLMLASFAACGDKEDKDTSEGGAGANVGKVEGGDTAPETKPDEPQTPVDDGLATVLLPVAMYTNPGHAPEDGVFVEYNEYGNMTCYSYIMGSEVRKTSTINYDSQSRPTYVKNFHRDEYNFLYDDSGKTVKITGQMNAGNDRFELIPSPKEGAAYQLTVYRDADYIVEQYSEDYLLLEQLWYKHSDNEHAYQRRYYTYDDQGRLAKWEKAYDERYDFTDTYTDADFDEMGHCLTRYSINGYKFQYTEEITKWECTLEKDAAGNVTKDVHTSKDEERFIVTYTYNGDINENGFSYTIQDTKEDDYFCFEYKPFKVKCDEMQLAMINIYSQDFHANNVGSFRNLTVNWDK